MDNVDVLNLVGRLVLVGALFVLAKPAAYYDVDEKSRRGAWGLAIGVLAFGLLAVANTLRP